MIIWNGIDLIFLIILVICGCFILLLVLWGWLQDKIDKYFERRNKK